MKYLRVPADYNFMLIKNLLLVFFLLAAHISSQIVPNSSSKTSSLLYSQTIQLTHITNFNESGKPSDILSQFATPGFSREHGFNYVVLDGWTCNSTISSVIDLWNEPTVYLNNTLGDTDIDSQTTLKQLYSSAGISVLVNAFGQYENPASQKLDPLECGDQLSNFIQQNGLDGVSIDFRDRKSLQNGTGLTWLTDFSLSLISNTDKILVGHVVDISFLNESAFPNGGYELVVKSLNQTVNYYEIKYGNQDNTFLEYNEIFGTGNLSIPNLKSKGIPEQLILVGKPANTSEPGYVSPSKLLEYYKKASFQLNWVAGFAFSEYIADETEDQTSLLTLRKDVFDIFTGVQLDKVNFWWPPEKTVADIGVPGYSSDNHYNHYIFGTWTCRLGAFDIAQLWSRPSIYLNITFGNSTSSTQQFLKQQYAKGGKKILVRAFGDAESPTSGNLDPYICAKGLALFVKSNNFDGADINYQDNVAFNGGTAQNWLIKFTSYLRSLIPFHIISHTGFSFHFDESKYLGGGYRKINSNVGQYIDFYNVVYYGQQHTQFDTYQELFVDSGSEFLNVSISELVEKGFSLNKLVVSKPTTLYDAQGAGFVDPNTLRQIFIQASLQLGWRGGLCFSSYLNDQDGQIIEYAIRGINISDSIRFSYVDNVNVWWPPQSTLGQMGVPTLSKPNIYNYFAYAFWTCGSGAQGILKVYEDPIKYLGTGLGTNKSEVQQYIKKLYANGSTKLLVSAFGASEFPVKDGLDPVVCANRLGQFLQNNSFDGIDIDFEDSGAFVNKTGENWLIRFMKRLRQIAPFYIITHAPQAPYFSSKFSELGAYKTVNSVVGKYIDFYNIQFYNQGNTTYETYQQLFIDSGTLNPNTSVFQIINGGVPQKKVVVGKPVNLTDAYNTGFVNGTQLHSFFKEAVGDKSNPGWTPSAMFWNYLSDLSGQMVAEVMA